jgi:hypothetical protein
MRETGPQWQYYGVLTHHRLHHPALVHPRYDTHDPPEQAALPAALIRWQRFFRQDRQLELPLIVRSQLAPYFRASKSELYKTGFSRVNRQVKYPA